MDDGREGRLEGREKRREGSSGGKQSGGVLGRKQCGRWGDVGGRRQENQYLIISNANISPSQHLNLSASQPLNI